MRIEMENAVKPIEFKRLPDKRLRDPAFFGQLAGFYAIGPNEFTVTLRPDGVLTFAGRTGPQRELLGLRGTRFQVKQGGGLLLEFVPDASGRFTQVALQRSGGSTVAQRKP